MKTMKKGDEVIRVSEENVASKLSSGYAFCNKGEWKKLHPGRVKKAEPKVVQEKVKEKKDQKHSNYRDKRANN
jgi:hypothetical protein